MPSLISIVVPTFNRAKTLVEAVESVLHQTIGAWELLVVDDGSSDETEAVMSEFLADSRIRYFKQENRGQAAARNRGISHAGGDLVAFLDSDNKWLPHKLAVQAEFMEQHPKVDVLYGEIEMIDSSGRVWPGPSRQRFSGIVWRELLIDNFVNFNTSMVRRERLTAIGGLNTNVRRGDDYDLWLRLAPKSTFHFLPGVVTQYRVEGHRISDDTDGRMGSNLAAVDRFLQSNPELLDSQEIAHIRARIYGRFARAFSASGRAAKGAVLAIRAIARAPFSSSAWRTLVAVMIEPFRKWAGSRSSGVKELDDG